jgi:diguanylate cyclase (GGDEF)-like protein
MVRLDGSGLAVEVLTVKMVWEGRDAFQVITRDVSERRAAEAALRYQAALVNHVSDAIIGTSADGTVTSWNPAAENIYGCPAVDAIGRPISAVVGAALDPAGVVMSGGIVATRHHGVDGRVLEVRVSAAAMADGYVLVCCDLTALRRAEHHFEAVVAAMMEGVIVTDKDGQIKSINPAAMRAMGVADGESLIGVNFLEVTEPLPFYDKDGVRIPPQERPVLGVVRTGVPFENLVSGWEHPDGRKWLLSSCRLLEPERVGQSDIVLSFADITTQRTEAEELRFLADHDALTNLPNRSAVLKRLTRALDASPHIALRAVLFVDVDGLKAINDSLGHEAGDDVLRTTAQRLRQTAAANDIVGRWAGDEFVLLVFSVATAVDLGDLVDRLHAGLALPARIAGTEVRIRASIGVVEVHRFERRTSSEILRDADLAMYAAKRSRR